MALLFIDSFQHYLDADWTKYTQKESNGASSSFALGSFGRRANLAIKTQSSSATPPGRLRKVLPASGAVAIAGFAFKAETAFASLNNTSNFNGGNSTCELVTFLLSGTVQIWFRVTTTGTIQVMRGANTVVASTTAALTQNVWQYLEFKVTIHPSAGTIDIRVDGSSVMSLTGQNTQGAGSATWDEYAGTKVCGTSSVWYYQDLYVADGSGSAWNNFKGDTRVDALYPNAPGTSSMWTPSTGTDRSATVDEPQANGDTDYNQTANIGDKDTLNFPNVPVPGAQIYGVQIVVQIRKTDTGTAGHKPVIRIGATDYLGAEVAVPTSYAFLRQCYDTKPSDGSAWIDTDINNAEFGYQKSS